MSQVRFIVQALMGAVYNGVSFAGAKVFYEEPYARNAAELKEQYQCADGQLRGFFPRLVGRPENLVATTRIVATYRWKIYGYWNMNPALGTGLQFLDAIDSIADAVRADDTLGGNVATCIDEQSGEAGIQLEDQTPVMFAGVLCHAARWRIATKIFIAA